MTRFDRIRENRERKKREAKERQEAYEKLSIPMKIQRLDEKFGPGLGAKRHRAKLQKLLDKNG